MGSHHILTSDTCPGDTGSIQFRLIVLIALMLVFSSLLALPAQAETRALKLYFLHTGERAEITYKRNGKYIDGGLKKINRFLRDWRRNEPTKMDPRLLDLIWETYQETGSNKYIHVISAYRSPATNNLLRKRGRGVARKSQHTLGKALDFFIPGVSLRKLRNIALRKGLGGVGYYPKSGSPFVHMDTGRVRHWPRMSRKELARVFPKGKTLHVPSDGKPLARYDQAKAEYERKIKGRDQIVVAKAEEIRERPGFFARLLNREEDDQEEVNAATAPRPVAVSRQPAQEPELVAARDRTSIPLTPSAADRVLERASPPAVASTIARANPVPAAPIPAAPVPEAVTAPDAPSPAPVAPEPELVDNTPEQLLAAIPDDRVPVPLVAPRTAEQIVVAAEPAIETVPTQPPQTEIALAEDRESGTVLAAEDADLPSVEVEQGDELGADEANVTLAYAVPRPAPRQGLATLPDTLSSSVQAEPSTQNRIIVAALSPGEIEDLRREIYAGLDRNVANSPQSAEAGQLVASLAAAPRTVPEPSASSLSPDGVSEPGKADVAAADQGVVTEPVSDPVQEVAEPETDSVEVASLSPIEPGVRTTSALAIPAPNPLSEDAEEADAVASVSAPGIPIPQPAQRPVLVASAPLPVQGDDVLEASDEISLEALRPSVNTQAGPGKWALAADASIEEIAEIHPPTYALNIIRQRPSSVLTRGFVTGDLLQNTRRFSGSSLEFLDFYRFQ